MPKPKPEEKSVCLFSDDRCYRYSLEHRWDEDTIPSYARKTVVFLLLNPSVANETQLDPTLRRCRGFAKALGAGGMIILNAFAFIGTDPRTMLAAPDPIGPLNDQTILRTAERSDVTHIICGWGCHAKHMGRDKALMEMLPGKLMALKVNKDGSCAHPLYLPKSCIPLPFGYQAQPIPTHDQSILPPVVPPTF